MAKEQVESSIDRDVIRTAIRTAIIEDKEIGNFYDLSPRNGGD